MLFIFLNGQVEQVGQVEQAEPIPIMGNAEAVLRVSRETSPKLEGGFHRGRWHQKTNEKILHFPKTHPTKTTKRGLRVFL